MLWVPARGQATLVVQLRLSRRRQSWAGSQAFRVCLVNLADPFAEEITVDVTARVVTQLVSIIGLDEPPPSPISLRVYSPGTPTPSSYLGSSSSSALRRRARSSSIEAFGSFGAPEGGSLRLAPLAIPPLRGAGGRLARSFQVKNVSGETVLVTLGVTPAPEVAGVLSLGASLQQQDSSTGVYASAGADGRPSPSVALLPGDLLDVQVECLALPGARLSPELLPPPEPFLAEEEEESTSAELAAAAALLREPAVDWGQHIRLMGTVRVEIALEDRAGDSDLMGLAVGGGGGGGAAAPASSSSGSGGGGQDEGVLVESVALVGSLVPGPTFGLSHSSVTVALRPPESGGGGGGGHGDGTHPYDPEGPASFFVESFSQSLGPVRLELAGGGRLFLARGVRVPAAEDEGGGRRRPARVARVVTATAEPSRVVVSATRRREVAVRLVAAEQRRDGAAAGATKGDAERAEGGGREDDGEGEGEGEDDQRDLFLSIVDLDHPGYPPQVVSVQVEVPAPVALIPDHEDGDGGGDVLVGRDSPGAVDGDGVGGAGDVLAAGERLVRGGYGLSAGDCSNTSARIAAEEGKSLARPR